MDYPKTAAEWWHLLEINRYNIRVLVEKYHPSNGRKHNHKIIAPAAESLCKAIRKEVDQPAPTAVFDVAYQGRSGKQLLKLLNDTWFGMPESRAVRSEPGFHALCDLCSEGELVADPT